MRTRTTRQRLQWATLVAMPLLIGLAMWPVARHNRQQAATRALRAEIGKDIIQLDVIQQLVAAGADVNVRSADAYNMTMLHTASLAPMNPERERLALVRLLLAHGANINARDGHERTPLMCAALIAKPELVRLLLDLGASVNVRRGDEWSTISALNMARDVLMYGPTPEERHNAARIVQMLKAAGARPLYAPATPPGPTPTRRED